MDTGDLIKRCSEKNVDAWSEFITTYSGLIRYTINRQSIECGLPLDHHEISDILQEMLASLWSRGLMRDVARPESLPYWLAIVAKNTTSSYIMRTGLKEHSRSLITEDEPDEDDALKDGLQKDHMHMESLYERDTASFIEKAIDALPHPQGLILKLNLIDGLKYREISGMLRIPVSSVSSYLRRGKEHLRKDVLIRDELQQNARNLRLIV